MNIWWIIITAIVVTVALRILPIFLSKMLMQKSKSQRFSNFLDYASCSTVGCMIYVSAFYHTQGARTTNKIPYLLCNILILIIAFCLSLKLKKPIRVFIICIVLYLIMNIIIFS